MAGPQQRSIDSATVYRNHRAFVCRALSHFGVRTDEIRDAQQEVFVVVHRRRADFDGRTSVRNWLYGIARRVSSDQRKKRQRRLAHLRLVPDADAFVDDRLPAEQLDAANAAQRCLESLDPDKRVALVMAELQGMTAPEIANTLRVNLNTIYARLRAARRRVRRLS